MASLLRTVLARPSLFPSTSSSLPALSSHLRHFSSSPVSQHTPPLKAGPDIGNAPTYPHGFARWYKKSNRGIYGRTRLRVHKQVSDGYPSQRVLTRWRPNVHRKRLWSACLGRHVLIRMVLRILRSIDKAGGLDRYLLGQSPGRIRELGPTGWALRWRVLRTPKGVQMWEEERLRLGLPPGMGPRSPEFEQAIANEVESWREDARRVIEGVPVDLAPELEMEIEAEDEEEAQALLREREIDNMLDREDRLAEHEEGGLDLSRGSESERHR